jgi:hypothetical protein
MLKGISWCIPAVLILYFGSLNPSLPPLLFQQLSIHIVITSTFTDVMFYNTVHALSFLPFLPSSSAIEQFHNYKHILSMSLYEIIFVFMYMFIFWIYLPHMRENMQPLSFWIWITSLIQSSNCIHLFTFKPHGVILPNGWVKLHCICNQIWKGWWICDIERHFIAVFLSLIYS